MTLFLAGIWLGAAAVMICKDWADARDLRGDYFLLFLVLCLAWPASVPAALLGAKITAKYQGDE